MGRMSNLFSLVQTIESVKQRCEIGGSFGQHQYGQHQ